MTSYSAFPVVALSEGPLMTGLTKREYMATAILAAMVSGFDPESKANGRFIPDCDYKRIIKFSHPIS